MSLLDKDLAQLQTGSGYKFSVTQIDKLGSSQYTLATIVMDVSGSVQPFAAQLETCLKTIFKACEKSPLKDSLMLRVTQFETGLTETHGFKLLSSIKEDDYTGSINIGGSTALFEATDEAIQASSTYGKQLNDMEFLVNAIVVVVTDGQNNAGSIMDPEVVGRSLEQARRRENLESILTVLVGVTNDDTNLDSYLQEFKDKAKFDSYVSIGKATPGKIAKLAQFISQSISSTSSALGTGAPSKPVTSFTF